MANPEGKYYPGKWLFYCDVCNKKMLSSEAKHRWDGLYVCKEDWEPRHPSDFIRARKETSNQLPWQRPGLNGQSGDQAAPASWPIYAQGGNCTFNGSTGIPGFAVAGCSRPSFGVTGTLGLTDVD